VAKHRKQAFQERVCQPSERSTPPRELGFYSGGAGGATGTHELAVVDSLVPRFRWTAHEVV
jgi:hypothetical protein